MHFSGTEEATHVIAPHVRYRIHRPIFSTARLPFLSHVPDHSDIAPYNPSLARALGDYDVIHTTDAVLASVRGTGLVTTATSTRPPTLDDVYLRLTGDTLAA